MELQSVDKTLHHELRRNVRLLYCLLAKRVISRWKCNVASGEGRGSALICTPVLNILPNMHYLGNGIFVHVYTFLENWLSCSSQAQRTVGEQKTVMYTPFNMRISCPSRGMHIRMVNIVQ